MAGTEPSTTGPPRTLLETTAEGSRMVAEWLREPVEHLRDARSELMLKLLFLDRRGGDITPLLTAQRAQLVQREARASRAAGRGGGIRAHAGALARREHGGRNPVRRRPYALIRSR